MPKKPKKKARKTEPKIETGEGIKKTKIRVIGIGGGGGTIVSEIALKMPKASFVVANTDRQALKSCSRKVTRFLFGQNLTHGLGTGMNAELGYEAAQNEKEKIKKLCQGQDLCILVVSLGGGAGSGAAPVFAKVSKSLGNLTYGIFTLPFAFEGKKKMEIARAALEKLKKEVNILSIIPNERIFQIIDKKTPLKQALSGINKNLAKGLEGLIETIYEPGLINVDFADLRTIFQGSGKLAYLNTIKVQKKQGSAQSSAREIIEKAINNPLYPYNIRGASRVLFNISGEKELQMDEVSQILTAVSELVNKEAKIIFGISQSKKYTGFIKVSLLAVGCRQKIFFNQPFFGYSNQPPGQLKTKPAKKRLKKNKKVAEEQSIKQEKKTNNEEKQEIPVLKKEKRILKQTEKSKSQKKKIKIFKKALEIKEPKKEEFKEDVITLRKPSETRRSVAEENKTAAVIFNNDKVRKNALQIKKEAEEEEKEMLEREKFWESPAFLRKKHYD